jgi:signal transduction histidine kinase
MDKWLEAFARANFLRSGDTAHDLKTPLNVAVLNLELLRMRIRKLTDGKDDAKILEYTGAIETELRRMARIFDTYFLLSAPPKAEGAPPAVDLVPIAVEIASSTGIAMTSVEHAEVAMHEARIRQAIRLFFDAAAKLLPVETLQAALSRDETQVHITIAGLRPGDDFESSKLFKFYYTDPSGNPDLSLATARLITETYGGELKASEESDKVAFRLSLPLGEQ